MEIILHMILGGLLTLLGGLITLRYQDKLKQISEQKKEDESLLFEAIYKLFEYKDAYEKSVLNYDIIKIAIRIKSHYYRNLAIELIKFVASDDAKAKEDFRKSLIPKIQSVINEPLGKELKEVIKKQ